MAFGSFVPVYVGLRPLKVPTLVCRPWAVPSWPFLSVAAKVHEVRAPAHDMEPKGVVHGGRVTLLARFSSAVLSLVRLLTTLLSSMHGPTYSLVPVVVMSVSKDWCGGGV